MYFRLNTAILLLVSICFDKFVALQDTKKKRNFHASNWLFAQTTHVDITPEILHAGSCPGNSYIFQVSWKSVEGSRICGWSKIALSNWLYQLVVTEKQLPLWLTFYCEKFRDNK